MQFGEWVVTGYVDGKYWECKCSCGTSRVVIGKTLKSGSSRSCGHRTNQFKDITGQVFNGWKVIEYLGDYRWRCMCSCGNTGVVQSSDLRSGKSKDCGHGRYEKLSERNSKERKNLEGRTFGHWNVIRYLGDKKYLCRCSCGAEREVASAGLLGGTSSSCGHTNGEKLIIDLVGRKVGKLEVLRYHGKKRWVCKCECGKLVSVQGRSLRNGEKTCCGCSIEQRGLKVEELLSAIENSHKQMGKKPTTQVVAKMHGMHPATIRRNARKYGVEDLVSIDNRQSMPEYEIKKLFPTEHHGYRGLLGGHEVDLYYEDSRVAVEYNGSFWHREAYRGKRYHLDKTLKCIQKRVQVVHIFEYEWMNNRNKERILKLLGRYLGNVEDVRDRDTQSYMVGKEDADEFLNRYSLKIGKSREYNVGCFRGQELIGVMELCRDTQRNGSYEIVRVAWKDGVRVVNGEKRLFDCFKENYNPEYVWISIDLAKFSGNEFLGMGFKTGLDLLEEPRGVWTKSNSDVVIGSLDEARKELYRAGVWEPQLSISEMLQKNRYYRIYDAGHLKMEWHKIG